MNASRKASEIISAAAVLVLFAVILSLVVLTAGSYRSAGRSLDANSNTRAVLSYIVNCVRESGNEGSPDLPAVSVADRSGTECLVIQDGKGFEQRFYGSEGKLMEEYTRADAEISPEEALVIGDTELLEFSISRNGLLTIRTDSGSSCVSIRKAEK